MHFSSSECVPSYCVTFRRDKAEFERFYVLGGELIFDCLVHKLSFLGAIFQVNRHEGKRFGY
jgi:hypothetical protein